LSPERGRCWSRTRRLVNGESTRPPEKFTHELASEPRRSFTAPRGLLLARVSSIVGRFFAAKLPARIVAETTGDSDCASLIVDSADGPADDTARHETATSPFRHTPIVRVNTRQSIPPPLERVGVENPSTTELFAEIFSALVRAAVSAA
jgi:hypothetical protein